MSDEPQSNTIHFGVGCFLFGVKKPPPAGFTGRDYVAQLRETLGKITNLSELEIDASENFLKHEFRIDEPTTTMSDGFKFFPGPGSRLDISFQLYIPNRLHADLIPWHQESLTSSERFRIDMRFPFFFPITFIQPLNPPSIADPSEDVVLLRMFLVDQFDRMKSDFFRFDFLGPSPFHANFCLQAQQERGAATRAYEFVCDIQRQRGYDQVLFSYDQSAYDGVSDARNALFHQLEDEIGFFYMINHIQCMQNRGWETVESTLTQLMQEKEARSLCSICQKMFTLPKRVEKVVLSLTEFEKNALMYDYAIKKGYTDLCGSSKQPFLDTFIQRERQDSIQYPTAQAREVVALVESRSSKAQDALILLLSAILGGAVGAIITLLASAA